MSSFTWILDSCASHHLSLDSSCFTSMSHLSFVPIMTVDGTLMPLASVGSIVISLSNVYDIPNLTLNLAYVGQLCNSSNLVTFFSSCCFVGICSLRILLGQAIGRGDYMFWMS